MTPPRPRIYSRDMAETRNANLVTGGYVAAVVFPVVGLVVGAVLLARGAAKDGALVIVLSVVVMAVYALLFG